MTSMVTTLLTTAVIALSAAPARAAPDVSGFPVTIDNCGISTTYARPPRRAFTMNQSATEILRLAGAQNIFADTRGSWATVSWDEVVSRNPDVIVLVNASWAPVSQKTAVAVSQQRAHRYRRGQAPAFRHDRFQQLDAGHPQHRRGA